MSNIVGVLALQGAFQKHLDCLDSLGSNSMLVRNANELTSCNALIIPGGESTTISLLLQKSGLYQAIKIFADSHPVLGVCAGLILMANEVDDKRVVPLALMPFKALRNFYGSQVHSFNAEIKLYFDSSIFQAAFIRAPEIVNTSSEIKILATYNNKAVMIGYGKHMALSFHPELSNDTRVHKFWLDKMISK